MDKSWGRYARVAERIILYGGLLSMLSNYAIRYARIVEPSSAGTGWESRLATLEIEARVKKAVDDERWTFVVKSLESINRKLDRSR